LTAPRFALVLLVDHIEACAELAPLAERAGFEMLGIVDSQNIACDVYVSLAVAARTTSAIRLGPAVTNPLTRHVVVAANAIATVDRLSGGRAFLGLGSGDSAAFTLALRPARLQDLERTARDLQALTAGETVERDGRRWWVKGAARRVPFYLGADGPRARRLAGRVADGVFIGSGFTAEEVRACRADLAAGAGEAGRQAEALDVWWLVKANVDDARDRAIDDIKMALAASGNRAFRHVAPPAHLRAGIEGLQREYDPHRHEAVGPAGNGRLTDRWGLTEYLAERFAIAGTPDDCVAQVRRAVEAGADRLLLTGITPDPRRFIERWATEVMPRIAPEGGHR
jgi:5,10-methylenetetrahydromethanopterin reductase